MRTFGSGGKDLTCFAKYMDEQLELDDWLRESFPEEFEDVETSVVSENSNVTSLDEWREKRKHRLAPVPKPLVI